MMKKRTLFAAAIALVAFTVAVGSAGGRTSGTGASVVLQPLIGTNSNDVQQVTFGGKIGFHLDVTNTGTSTFNHLVIAVAIGAGSFSDASTSTPNNCAADPANAKRMVCTLVQMRGGGAFSVDFRFNAPTSGSTVDATPSLTVDAKTQGSPGNNGTQSVTGLPVTTTLVPSDGNKKVKTFARANEAIATGPTLPQHSKFTMPDTLRGLYGVETSVEEQTTDTPLCEDCPKYVTELSIPDSLDAFSPAHPFTFTVTLEKAGVPKHYSPIGLYHDTALIPMCATSPLSATTHICLTSFTGNKNSGFVATGQADQNGRLGFG
jgi:hypothetical protein